MGARRFEVDAPVGEADAYLEETRTHPFETDVHLEQMGAHLQQMRTHPSRWTLTRTRWLRDCSDRERRPCLWQGMSAFAVGLRLTAARAFLQVDVVRDQIAVSRTEGSKPVDAADRPTSRCVGQ